MSTHMTTIEAKLTFADGETVEILLAEYADAARGNVTPVLGRSVPVREAILSALREKELIGDEIEEECGHNDQRLNEDRLVVCNDCGQTILPTDD